jgi:hypothetical protein
MLLLKLNLFHENPERTQVNTAGAISFYAWLKRRT